MFLLYAETLFLCKLQQQIDHEPDVVRARWLFEWSQPVPDTTYDYTMVTQEADTTNIKEDIKKPGLNNPREQTLAYLQKEHFSAEKSCVQRYCIFQATLQSCFTSHKSVFCAQKGHCDEKLGRKN